MTQLPAHSPLGASGAERWMKCPGSTALLKHLDLPPSDDPDYRREGTAAHAAAFKCLEGDLDAWEIVGTEIEGCPVTIEMGEAVQVYLDTVRPIMGDPETRQVFLEQRIGPLPEQPLFFGTVDCGVLQGDHLHVNDYKHGQGITVEVEHNPQLLYYAYGILRLPDAANVKDVTLRIIQPRGFHTDGPVREWTTSAIYVRSWAEGELLPAMERTALDHSLDAGAWCRFCPAKLVCPMLTGLFGAAAAADPRQVVRLTDRGLAEDYARVQGVKFYLKALEDEMFRRLNTGKQIEGAKLVAKKSNRVWKDGAIDIFKARFGDAAFRPAEPKSPAEMEKIPGAKDLAKEWAYSPFNGLTVALADDPRPAVKVETSQQVFGAAAGQLTSDAE